MNPGDIVQVRRKAPHVFDSFRGATATVLRVQKIGGTPWAQLEFSDLGRTTWLPVDRLELLEEGAAT